MNPRRRNGQKAESLYREMLEAGRSVKLQITMRIARELGCAALCDCYFAGKPQHIRPQSALFHRPRPTTLDPGGHYCRGLNSLRQAIACGPGSSWFLARRCHRWHATCQRWRDRQPFGPLAKWARIGSKAVGLHDPTAVRTKNGRMLFNPPADTAVHRGDFLIVMGQMQNLRALESLLTGAGATR